LVEFLEEE